MKKKVIRRFLEENANAVIENVIILPLIFIVIYAIIVTGFIIHDRSTVESAARRGAIYAAHYVSDPNYQKVLNNSGHEQGQLDVSSSVDDFKFTGFGKGVNPYRHLQKNKGLEAATRQEIMAVIEETRIPWRELDINEGDIVVKEVNSIFTHEITIEVEAGYPVPAFFEIIGLDRNYDYSVTTNIIVNDPDEFIRNADLCVDIIVSLDNGKISGVVSKIETVAQKILKWLEV